MNFLLTVNRVHQFTIPSDEIRNSRFHVPNRHHNTPTSCPTPTLLLSPHVLLLPHQSSPVTYPPQRPTDPSNVKLETLYPRCFLEFIPNCTNTFNSSSSYNGNDPKRLHRISRLVYLNQLTDGTLTRETGIFWSVLILNESFLCITVSFRWRFVC